MPSPFRDAARNSNEIATILETEISARRATVAGLFGELEELDRQISAHRDGHPVWPRLVCGVVGGLLGVLLAFLLRGG